MRKDITIENILTKGGEKINKSALARQFNCCWKTIDRKLNPEKYKKERKKRVYTSILDSYKAMIIQKISERDIPATGIYFLLKRNYDYNGSYSTVKNFVSKEKNKIKTNLTIRFNTIQGFQSQVDWKESVILTNKEGIQFKINIFLIVLGYSRYKYIELTSDRTQQTLFRCLTNAFTYFDGTSEEIIFDNMKTVVDQTKSDYKKVVINQQMSQFAKDANFKIYCCRPYRPNTKGKVETLAKIINRLKAFDREFETWNDLKEVVEDLLYELNYVEKSQATNEIPINRMLKEKEYLNAVNIDLLKTYYNKPKLYKVSKESMILYQGNKYSVPINLIGKSLSIKEDDEFICIYFNTTLICSYQKNTSKRFNYKKSDYLDILKHSAYQEKSYDEIEEITLKNLKSLDETNIEEE